MEQRIKYFIVIIISCFLAWQTIQSQTAPEITLTWSTPTYVPLDYLGKPLPTKNSLIKVAANLETTTPNPQELIYNWFLDDNLKRNDSGQGKQIFRFNIGEILNQNHLVKVDIYNKQGALLATSPHLMIKAVEPEIVLEARTPSQTYSALKKEYQFRANQQIIFTAQPYFFNVQNIDELSYNWLLGSQPTSQINEKSPQLFILKVGQLTETLKENLMVQATSKNQPMETSQINTQITLVPEQ